MGVTFNADEVFEMAEQIERNGAKFYRAAAVDADSLGLAGVVGGALAGRLAAEVRAVLTFRAVGIDAALLLALRTVVSVLAATGKKEHRTNRAKKLDCFHRIPPEIPRVPTESSAWSGN